MRDGVPYTARMSRHSRKVRGVWPGLMAVAVLTAAASVAAQDWPQWRGPGSAAISTEAPLPTTWSATEHLAWRATLAVPLGLAVSSLVALAWYAARMRVEPEVN